MYCSVKLAYLMFLKLEDKKINYFLAADIIYRSHTCFIFSSQQMYTDVATGELHDDLVGDVTELEQLIIELQDLSSQLRSQWEAILLLSLLFFLPLISLNSAFLTCFRQNFPSGDSRFLSCVQSTGKTKMKDLLTELKMFVIMTWSRVSCLCPNQSSYD